MTSCRRPTNNVQPASRLLALLTLVACVRARSPEEACNDRGMAYGYDEHHVGHCAPPGFCVVSCGGRRWALLPEQCGHTESRATPPSDPSHGTITGKVEKYPEAFSPNHDFTKDTSPAASMVVTATTRSFSEVNRAVPEQSAITGADGSYVIPNLVPGTYHVMLFRNCNNTIASNVVVVEGGKRVVVDLKYGEEDHNLGASGLSE